MKDAFALIMFLNFPTTHCLLTGISCANCI